VRIAVVGPGSVGCFFAAQMTAAGHDVVACARRPFDTYIVDSATVPMRAPAHVITDPALATPVDVVIVAVKSHHTESASEWLRQLCTPSTIVVVAQNGLEGAERVRPYVGDASVLASVVYCETELIAPGHTVHRSTGFLYLPDTDDAHRLAALNTDPFKWFRPSPSYVTELWRKLGSNVAMNGLLAITRRTRRVLTEPGVYAISVAMLRECWTVAALEGASLGPDDAEALVEAMAYRSNDGGSSTLYDRLAGRPTEHDAIYGSLVRAADRHGVPTPVTQMIRALLAAGDSATG
jgi:2-dehydropantoate 2-reductase